MWTRTAAALAVVLASLSGCERDESRASSGAGADPDQGFLISAAQGNLAEIEAGRLAMEKGNHPEVKQFGHHMMEDHGRANEALADLARKKGVTLPDRPDDEQRKEAERLKGLSGAEFDRQYMGLMVRDHIKTVALFEEKAKQARDADVRAHAEKTVPKLREHLKMARDVNAMVGGSDTE